MRAYTARPQGWSRAQSGLLLTGPQNSVPSSAISTNSGAGWRSLNSAMFTTGPFGSWPHSTVSLPGSWRTCR